MIGLFASMDVIDRGAVNHPQPCYAFSGQSARNVSWTLMKTNSNLEHDNHVELVVVVSIVKLQRDWYRYFFLAYKVAQLVVYFLDYTISVRGFWLSGKLHMSS